MAPEPRRFLNTCCFGISLRVGCFILGYLSLIANAIRMLNFIALATMLGIATNGFQENMDRKKYFKFTGKTEDLDGEDITMAAIGFVLLVVLVINVVWLGVNIAVLVGVHKRRPGPIRVYAALASVRLTLSIGEFIYLMISTAGGIQPQTFVGTLFELFLCAYFICIYCTYAAQLEKELKENNESGTTDQTADAQEFTNDIAFIYPTKIDKEILIPPKGGLA